jgi:hypothetical protein
MFAVLSGASTEMMIVGGVSLVSEASGWRTVYSVIRLVSAGEAWKAHPTLTERRHLRDRRAAVRDTPERRTMDVPLTLLAQDRRGWLTFRSNSERRRTPIPERWEELSDVGLRVLLNGARLGGPVRRPTE